MSGDGSAVSTGPMVPVLASNDEGRSRAVLDLLDAEGIPAILDIDLPGFAGFHEPVPEGWTQVFVPTSLREEALALLRDHDFEAIQKPRSSPALEVPRPTARAQRPPSPPRVGTAYEEGLRALRGGLDAPLGLGGYAPDDDEEDRLEEIVLPEAATPVALRLRLALAAIALGSVLQQLLTFWLGADGVLEGFGARQPLFSELHRLVTAASIHGGPAHALSNAAFGLIFGVVLFGTHRIGATALVWLVASAMGLAAEVALTPSVVVIGASAGNYGLVGLWTRGQMQRARLAVLPRREVLKTWGVILLLVPGALTPFSSTGSRIAVLAHVVGFLAGLALGGRFRRRLLPEGFELIARRSHLAGVVAVSATGAAWLLGLLRL